MAAPSSMVRPAHHLVFLAFGTWGDVLPLASLACAAADKRPELVISFASHAAHSAVLQDVFQDKRIRLRGINSQPVVPVQARDPPVRKSKEAVAHASAAPKIASCLPLTKRRRIHFAGVGDVPPPPPIVAANRSAAHCDSGLQATDLAQALTSTEGVQKAEGICNSVKEETGKTADDGSEEDVAALEWRQQEECLDYVRQALCARKPGDSALLIFNLFALEGFHLAQHFGVPCVAASPYLIPYGPPQGFQRGFRRRWPSLFERLQVSYLLSKTLGNRRASLGLLMAAPYVKQRLRSTFTILLQSCGCVKSSCQQLIASPVFARKSRSARRSRVDFDSERTLLLIQAASPPSVGWAEVEHWMWPLFDDARWGEFRGSLQLPRCPLDEDDLPIAPSLLYGFSSAVVPCPGYWPRSVHTCGFWPPPASWDHRVQTQSPARLNQCLLDARKADRSLVYIGFGAVGSMGLLPPASALLSSLLTALETAGMAGVLVTSGAPALEAECRSRQDLPQLDTDASKPSSMRTGVLLGRGRLLCLAGPVSHPWLFPQCALILHHAGSGTTAAALRAGVPQVTCPFIFDQFYWAGLLTSLGCSPPHLSAADLAQAGGPLGAVFRSAISLQSVAEKVASDIQKEDGVAAALRHLIPDL